MRRDSRPKQYSRALAGGEWLASESVPLNEL